MTQEPDITEVKQGTGRSALSMVEKALQSIELEVKTASCADFTRLLQLQRELRKEEQTENIRQIEVKWIDPPQAECCTEK